jgi:hypothetical protein
MADKWRTSAAKPLKTSTSSISVNYSAEPRSRSIAERNRAPYSRSVTVKSRPGVPLPPCGTDTMSRLICPPAISGGNPKPLTTLETVAPSGMFNRQ